MPLHQLLNRISPRQLFLVDSLGAILSAVLLGVVLVQLEHLFGMPQKILYYLAGLAGCFAIYSFICYWQFPEKWHLYLKNIAIVNLLYCLLTFGLVAYLHTQVTALGWTYFMLEIIIVSTLAIIELRVANKTRE